MKLILTQSEEPPASPGERLRWARKNARLSGPDLAGELGISRQALSQMELDKIPIPTEMAEKFASLLTTTPQWLRYGAGVPPRWPEAPLMVPEMALDRRNLDRRLLDPSDDTIWVRYRTRREWALPASEAQRIGAGRDKLIAVRVNVEVEPEFKRGDIVMLDRSANSFREAGYYGVIVDKEYLLAGLRTSSDARAVKILGAVVFSCRPRTNFSF